MKKINIIFVLLFVLLLALTGCGMTTNEPVDSPIVTDEIPVDQPEMMDGKEAAKAFGEIQPLTQVREGIYITTYSSRDGEFYQYEHLLGSQSVGTVSEQITQSVRVLKESSEITFTDTDSPFVQILEDPETNEPLYKFTIPEGSVEE